MKSPEDVTTTRLKTHRICVLLIDDQAMYGETVRRMLITEKDIDFHYCQDPLKAIRTANAVAPTVILQDLVMPEMDGLRLVRYIRANAATRETPLIVLSSKEEPKIKAEAFALGANDYMVKLPDRLEVVARIRYHSKGYIARLERNEAYQALLESQRELEKRNRFIKDTFGRYLSDEVVEKLLDDPGKIASKKRTVTLLMSDLRGFSTISERLDDPEKVVRIINAYLGKMSEVILDNEGIIDEFIGDSVLAIFGALNEGERPDDIRRDARNAAACAVRMQLAMDEVNRRLGEEALPSVAQGIGVNTGELVVGSIGSERRSKYGVVGKEMNLTARIESYTVGGQILISENTLAACGDVLKLGDVMQVHPKGVLEPIQIHELLGIGDRFNLFLPEKEAPAWRTVEPPLQVCFRVLEDKDVSGKTHVGRLVRLVRGMAEIVSETEVSRMANLRLSLIKDDAAGDGAVVCEEIYAKVMKVATHLNTHPDHMMPWAFHINFTSISPEAERFLYGGEGRGDAGTRGRGETGTP